MTDDHTPSAACYRRGCRSDPCRKAHTHYVKVMLRRSPPLTDATEVRDHIRFLTANGFSLNEIARRTGSSSVHLARIANGTTRRIQHRIAAPILGIGTHTKPWAPRSGWTQCKGCATNTRPHYGHGYCGPCYYQAAS